MLTEFSVGNYQAFSTTQRVPIKPITLIFGPNSAGKSALLRSLLVVRHALLTGRLSKSDDAGERHPGAYKDFVRNGYNEVNFEFVTTSTFQTEPPAQQVKAKVRWKETNGHLKSSNLELVRNDDTIVKYDEHLKVNSMSSTIQNQFDTVAREIYEDPAASVEILQVVRGALGIRLSLQNTKALPGGNIEDFKLEDAYPEDIVDLLGAFEATVKRDETEQGRPPEHMAASLRATKVMRAAVNSAQKDIHTAVMTVEENLRDCVTNMDYHGPQRPVPDSTSKEDSNKPGLKVWFELANNQPLLNRLNKWFNSDFFQKKHLLKFNRFYVSSEFAYLMASSRVKGGLAINEVLEQAFETKLDQDEAFLNEMAEPAMEAFGLWNEEAPEESLYETREQALDGARDVLSDDAIEHGWGYFNKLVDDGDRQDALDFFMLGINALHRKESEKLKSTSGFDRADIRFVDTTTDAEIRPSNIGIGYSQMVPLVASAYASEKRLIVIEQAELHVHPAVQAELADLFIDSAKNRENRYLIETHSEHMILRVLRRIRETTEGKEVPVRITPDDVAVLYVKPGPDGSEIVELRIDERGRFKDNWPSGFFEERLDELF